MNYERTDGMGWDETWWDDCGKVRRSRAGTRTRFFLSFGVRKKKWDLLCTVPSDEDDVTLGCVLNTCVLQSVIMMGGTTSDYDDVHEGIRYIRAVRSRCSVEWMTTQALEAAGEGS
jgi:hypothetical protein